MRRRLLLPALVASSLLIACDGDPPPSIEPTPMPTCAAPIVANETDATTSVDTTGGPTGGLALTECWGAANATGSPPQAVIAYTVPGTTATRTTIAIDAPTELDVVIAVRRGGCETPAWARCFDVAEPGSLTLSTTGGELLHVVVTARSAQSIGSDAIDAGPVTLTWSSTALAAPVIEATTVEIFHGQMSARLRGRDADGDVMGALFSWLDATGDPLTTGTPAVTIETDLVTFDEDVTGDSTIDVTATAPGYSLLESADVRRARISFLDVAGNTSEPLDVDVFRPLDVGFEGACDPLDSAPRIRRCVLQLECVEGACVAPEPVAAACASAEILDVPTPDTETTSVRRTGTLVRGDGVIRGSGDCYGKTPGVEHLYRVVVPEGRFDLIARTDMGPEGSGMGVAQDDVLYIRRTCEDPDSQPDGACNDGGSRSRIFLLDADPGEYTVFIEDFDGVGPGDEDDHYTLDVALRPVLPRGAACDVDGMLNRCADGECPRAGMCP